MTNVYDNLLNNYRTFTFGRWLILVILIVAFYSCATAIRNQQNPPSRSNVTPSSQETPRVPTT